MPHEIARKVSQSLLMFLVVIVLALADGTVASAQNAQPIYKFQGLNGDLYDGAGPRGPLTLGSDGTLYGTTYLGGAGADDCGDGQGDFFTCGTVFQLRPPAANSLPWTESVIYSFGTDPLGGVEPVYAGAALALDASGNLYGTNAQGGSGRCPGWPFDVPCGVVFQIVRPENGPGTWIFNPIYSFQPTDDGNYPEAGLIVDNRGNLYGTTAQGGTPGVDAGTVFELAPPTSQGGAWTETVLYRFQGAPDGGAPESNLVFDGAGNLFGTTLGGGDASCGIQGSGCGTVFELSPPKMNGAPWTETVLYSFQGGSDGEYPNGIILGKDGSLYGTTQAGGGNVCRNDGDPWGTCGTVFRLSPPNTEGDPWSETILYRFRGGSDGDDPQGNLVMDAEGRLYGTAPYGGRACPWAYGCGTVFALAPKGDGWEEKTLYMFGAQNGPRNGIPAGYSPQAGLTLGNNGVVLFGTASDGGLYGGCYTGGNSWAPCGTVFEISK